MAAPAGWAANSSTFGSWFGGTTFNDNAASTQQLTSINLRTGWWIDAIQGVNNNGPLAVHGGIGGGPVTVTWPANEYLVGIQGNYGTYIGKISFVTNTGRVLGPYGAGLGGNNLFSFNYTVPTGNAITGFSGRSASFVNALGVAYAKIATTPTPTNDLVVNGSFETPSTGTAVGFYSTITGWTGITDSLEIGPATAYGVGGASGQQVVELDANIQGQNTGFYQLINTTANQNYQLAVDVAARAGTVLATNSVEVWWRNQYLATIDPTTSTFKTYSFSVLGSGGADRLEFREQAGDDNSLGGIVDNVRLTPVTVKPAAVADLAVTLAPAAPAFTVNALSELPVTVSNLGSQAVAAPITLSLPLPVGVSAPLKFALNADAWVCLNSINTLLCTYSKGLASGASTTVRLPLTPAATTSNAIIGPFVASVAAVAGETNILNNSSPTLLPQTGVLALNLSAITDPNYSKPLLNPTSIPKFALPLPNALASFFQHTPNASKFQGADFYNLDVKQVAAQILPPGFPSTQVFAYGDPARPDTFTYPAHTIVARSVGAGLNAAGLGRAAKIQFNDTRTNLTHLLPVDHSIHGAMAGEPEIRSVAHFHGVKKVDQLSDGYPEGWRSPNGQTGNQFSVTKPTVSHNPNAFDQPNNQESTLLWYHDHTLGMTRLNVYAGMAGLYLLRDDHEMSMINANKLPNGAYELPLVLQDRAFHADGSLAYPDLNPDVLTAPKVSMVPEFYGDVMVVNGVAWPFLEVEPRRYRFRMLNGSDSRFYTLKLSNNAAIQVIGTEGGFLNAPVSVNTLTIAPGERYDLVLDFSAVNGQTVTLTNSANSPFPNGAPVTAGLDDQIMQFRVNQPLSTVPNNPLPTSLRPVPLTPLVPTVATPRQVLLAESVDNNGRILPILGTVTNGILGWMDTVTETPAANSIETWEIYNSTVDAHPIHLHGGHFQVVDRQNFSATVGTNLSLSNITLPTAAVAAAGQEQTWKDTVITYPGQVTRIRVKFENAGLFVWHCHILEHEDHDMMRPLLIK